ncbi:Smr/MutS family protein [Qingshengfaniella alkalisoli]|uniref:DNA mismatch repair protein MutS n=1 Tax=Qingshengfaniella alkalisoli TaxID=2599296 RepID=A0A5B8IZD9_9RHOB|nr:Smr/MutS family protein [Qingshengfaniella alkalisoli]QDY69978.1 DNA mismatch repair protein MutS [Qingshengfaniella alkalisoli]
MPRKPPRRLTPEERALWDSVASSVTPNHADLDMTVEPTDDTAPRGVERQIRAKQTAPLPDFRVGSLSRSSVSHDLSPSLTDRLSRMPIAVDRRTNTRMKRGKLKPEARLDLHGMTIAQAHPVLRRFVLDAQERGLRLVLVITGKGKMRDEPGPIPQPVGILRHQVPRWLALPPLNQAVLQVSEAHLRHGGGGAYYVYLRKLR